MTHVLAVAALSFAVPPRIAHVGRTPATIHAPRSARSPMDAITSSVWTSSDHLVQESTEVGSAPTDAPAFYELITTEEVRRKMQERTKPAVLLFGSKYCRACRSFTLLLSRHMARDHPGVELLRVHHGVATKAAFLENAVRELPTVAILLPGAPTATFIDATLEAVGAALSGESAPRNESPEWGA